MIRRRRGRAATEADLVEEQEVVRDAEDSLVAALQESDTAVEAIADSGTDANADRRRWKIGIAGSLLALLGLMVARRRR